MLRIDHLNVRFFSKKENLTAVRDFSAHFEAGKSYGLVGESGSGKTALSLALMGLLPQAEVSGDVTYQGQKMLSFSPREFQKIRGREIAMIFQEPLSALNPVYTIGSQILEPLLVHQRLSKKQARKEVLELLNWVGIDRPEERFDQYPHQFSGGMRQRVMIAMAISCRPKVLIADEPTTALDATIQDQILKLLKRLQRELSMTLILISHDLDVVSEMTDELFVMYAGHCVEWGKTQDVFQDPRMPYTQALIRSTPRLGQTRLIPIPGQVPDLVRLPRGCPFQDRCHHRIAECAEGLPSLRSPTISTQSNRLIRCIRELAALK